MRFFQVKHFYTSMAIPEKSVRVLILTALSGKPDSEAMSVANEIWPEKCLKILKSFPEFDALPIEVQNEFWHRTCLPSMALNLVKMEGIETLLEQLLFTMPDVDFGTIVKNEELRQQLEYLPAITILGENSIGGLFPKQIKVQLELLMIDLMPYFEDPRIFFMATLSEMLCPSVEYASLEIHKVGQVVAKLLDKYMLFSGSQRGLTEARAKFKSLYRAFMEGHMAIMQQTEQAKVQAK